jgi:hypothetical protein
MDGPLCWVLFYGASIPSTVGRQFENLIFSIHDFWKASVAWKIKSLAGKLIFLFYCLFFLESSGVKVDLK